MLKAVKVGICGLGTVGGGTSLPAQSACLKAIGCKGGGETPGANAKQLAHVVASATMAGELSLLAARKC